MQYIIEYDNEKHEYTINGLSISYDGLAGTHEYQIIDREDFIDELITWISECNNNNKQLMKNDLRYLMSIDDEYIFSSGSTSDFIAKSDKPETFNRIAQEIVDLQKEQNLNL